MKPFNIYLKSYITVCFATAVIYAFAVGAVIDAPVLFCFVDGVIYGGILFSAGVFLSAFFKFALPGSFLPGYRGVFLFLCAVVTALLMTGVETFALYLCFPSLFGAYVPSLPVRVFVGGLFFVVFYLWVFFQHRGTEGTEGHREDVMSENEMSKTTVIDRITVRNGNKIKIIPIGSIIYIRADGDYISIHTSEGKWLKEQTMKYTEDQLPMDTFVRIHRSYIVNIHHISRIERYGEKQLIVLHNNEKIKISAARYQLLKQILCI